jgi:hypothetical protein
MSKYHIHTNMSVKGTVGHTTRKDLRAAKFLSSSCEVAVYGCEDTKSRRMKRNLIRSPG